MRFDNIEPIPEDKRDLAAAALEFMRSVERGTAFIPIGEAIARGNLVFYRAYAGEMWPAKVTEVVGDKLVDIDVIVPGLGDPVHLTRIPFVTGKPI